MLNMFRILIHPSSGACDLFVELFRGLYCFGSMCVGVTLWFGCGGVVSVCRLKPAYGPQEHMRLHTRQSSVQNNKYQCRINTVVSPDDGHIVARNM